MRHTAAVLDNKEEHEQDMIPPSHACEQRAGEAVQGGVIAGAGSSLAPGRCMLFEISFMI
jgi:hypothetical protein